MRDKELKAKTTRCPLLRDEKVIYCKNFPLRKMLPVERISETENFCLKEKHKECPFFDREKMNLERDSNICPFVGFEVISFCVAYPLKKIAANHLMASPCNTGGYESCPVYTRMAGKDTKRTLIRYKGFLIDEAKRYLQNHIWVEKEDGVFRLGVDDFAQYILGDVSQVLTREKGDRIQAGEWLVRFKLKEGVFEVPTPVAGQVLGVNERLYEFPNMINLDPYGYGWILEVKIEGDLEILDAEGMKRILDRHIGELRQLLGEGSLRTMVDGGELTKDLRARIVEKDRIKEIVGRFLKGKEV